MPKGKKRDIVLSSEAKPVPSAAKSYFLGIGINNYQHFEPLSNAVADVQAISKLIGQRYHLDEGIFLLEEQATRDNIIGTLDQLVKRLHEEDKLILYYSGHGHLDKDTGLAFWIPYNASRGSSAQYIRNSTIRDYLKTIRARHTLLISDSCFSGSLFVEGVHRSTTALDELEKRTSRWAICSGRHDEEVYDGKPGSHSPFAQSIMEALTENERPRFNVAKLADRVMELTSSQYRQLPMGGRLFDVGDKGGQYVFRLKGGKISSQEVKPDQTENQDGFQASNFSHEVSHPATKTLKEVKVITWWGLVFLYLVGIIGLFAALGDIIGTDSFLFFLFPAPFFPGIWRRISKKSLLISSIAYAIIYYLLWFRWLSAPEENLWLLLPYLIVGGLIYYFLLPRWNDR